MVREEGGGEHTVDGDLGGAAHEGRQQDGHAAVPLRRQGPGGHDGGHRAAEAHQHGHDAPAGETDLPQQLVHDEGHPGHVAGVLQNGEEEEQHHDDGQEAQHAAHAGEHAVDHQGVDHRVEPVGGETAVRGHGEGVDPGGQQVRQKGADDVEGQEEDAQHDGEEQRQGEILVGDHPVDGIAALPLPALTALDHRAGADALDEVVAHIRQGGVAVHAALILHLPDAVLDQLQLVLVQGQARRDIRVPLDELGGGEPDGDAGLFRVVLDLVDHRVDAPVDRTGGAEVVHRGVHLVPCGLDSDLHQLVHALVLHGGDGDHRDAQGLGEPLDIDGAAAGGDLVHHVQSQHHGDPHLHQLEGQVQIPLDVGCVHDVDEAVGPLVEDEVPGDDLLRRIGPDGVDARQVHHRAVLLPPDGAGLLVHRHAGKVAHMLVGAGELVEQRGLAAVLIAGQCEDHGATSTSIFPASSFRRDRE